MIDADQLIDELLYLQKGYITTTRETSIWHRTKQFAQFTKIDEAFDLPGSRETLLEHVGHLPFLVSHVHPHLQLKVDLGHTLSLLSVHDIAETVTGDISSYRKTATHYAEEHKIARQLLHPTLVPLFEEYEDRQTSEAKYATSIDKIAPMILNLYDPELTQRGYDKFGITRRMLIDKKEKYVRWDPTISLLFDGLVNRLNPYFAKE